MHRSGTSALTGVLSRAGLFVGDEEELTARSWENPQGFFERRDARTICDALLHGSGADWWKVSSFDPDNADHATVREQRPRVAALVAKLDEVGVTWVLKEPRLCFLMPIFRSALQRPLAIIVHRHPLEVARSLRRRNGFPISAGLALWEAYTVSALRYGLQLPHIRMGYDELLANPVTTLERIDAALQEAGAEGLNVNAGAAGVQTNLRRERADDEEADERLSKAQKSLWAMLCSHETIDRPPQLSFEALKVLREFEADEAERKELQRALRQQDVDLKRVREAVEHRERAIADAEKALIDLRASKQASESENAALKQQVAQARVDLDRKRSELEVLRTETRSSEDLLSQQIKALKAKLGDEERARKALQDELNKAHAAGEESSQQITALEAKLGDGERARKVLQDELNKAHAAGEESSQQITALEAKLKDSEASKQAVNLRLEEARGEIETLTRRGQLATEQFADARRALDHAEKEGQRLREVVSGMEGERGQLMQRRDELSAILSAKEAELDELRASLLAEHSMLDSVKGELRSTKEALTARTNSLRAAEDEVNESKAKTEALWDALRERTASELELRRSIETNESELGELRANLLDTKKMLHQAQEQLRSTKDALTARTSALQLAEVEAGALKAKGETLQAALRDRTRETDGLERRTIALERERDLIRQRLEAVQQAHYRLQASRTVRLAGVIRRFFRNPFTRRADELEARVARLSNHPLFDVAGYLLSNPDIEQRPEVAVRHYLTSGAAEGRAPHILFDPQWYARRNAIPPQMTALEHYLETPLEQRGSGHPLFDRDWYLSQNPDVREDGSDPYVHFVEIGGLEGRSPHPDFDVAWYLGRNRDVAKARLNPLAHYLSTGNAEGRDPSPSFCGSAYLSANPDVAKAGLNPLVHWVIQGRAEGRPGATRASTG